MIVAVLLLSSDASAQQRLDGFSPNLHQKTCLCGVILSQYSTVVLTVVRVMIAKYRKSGIWGYRSSLTPEPVELKYCMSDYVAHRTQHAPRSN